MHSTQAGQKNQFLIGYRGKVAQDAFYLPFISFCSLFLSSTVFNVEAILLVYQAA